MRNMAFILLFVILSTFTVIAQDSTAPVITELSPQEAKVKEQITIKGSNFSKDKGKNKVWFGKSRAEILEATPESLVVTVPDIKKACEVTVEAMGKKSNEVTFHVLPYLEFVLSDKNISAGQKTTGVVRVKGSTKPWKIKVINKYYEVIDLVGGNEQEVITSGGADNIVTLELMAKQKGNFSLMCKKISELDEVPASVAKDDGKSKPVKEGTAGQSDKDRTSAASTDGNKDSAKSGSEGSAATKDSNKEPAKSTDSSQEQASSPKSSADSPGEKVSAVKETQADGSKGKTGDETKENTAVIKVSPSSAGTDTPAKKENTESSAKNNLPGENEKSPAAVSNDTSGANTSASRKDKDEVLSYCSKLKEKITKKWGDYQKLQKQIETKLVDFGKKEAQGASKKNEKIADIDARSKKITQRIKEIDKDIADLKKDKAGSKDAKDSEKIDKKIESLRHEKSKLYAEQKNIKAWKGSLASGTSKESSALKDEIRALSEKRDKLQKEIDSLQKEFEDKLKSLITGISGGSIYRG